MDQVIGVGGKVAELSVTVLRALGEAAKPALPVLQSAGEQALKLASPAVSDASRQATAALQGAGVDPAPVLSAAKVYTHTTLKTRSHSSQGVRSSRSIRSSQGKIKSRFDSMTDAVLFSRPSPTRRSRAARSLTPRSRSRRRRWRPSCPSGPRTTSWPPVPRCSPTCSCRRPCHWSRTAYEATKVAAFHLLLQICRRAS